IAYMFGDPQNAAPGKKNKLGSAMLLVRLAVLAIGILLAFAASGIPMDKLAIVIGALGVGIGFGLQNIVNNLVSGVILAFEKPIEVGDVIEMGTRSGVVKEIGIRSSKISAYDGSEVIVPNGDLISQQLINWTLSNRTRRVELVIGVNYGADIKTVTEILKQAVVGREGVMENPEPVVFLFQFGDNSINFRVFFWLTDLALAGQLQHDALAAIYENLQKAGIGFPYPQRDLHIRSVDPEILQQWKPGKPPEDNASAQGTKI
ncbi:MAG TPA: mechanosensitive ion channel domain-containing protein, partial [Chitinophaga sp.]